MKSHFTILTAAILICATILTISQTGSSAALGGGTSEPPIGKVCTVQFRRGDALGSGANLPLSPFTNGINGAETSVVGKLRNATDQWIVVERDGSNVWIPKSAILLIQIAAQ